MPDPGRPQQEPCGDVRLLGPDDADASTRMSAEAFGPAPAGQAAFTLGEGLWRWGLFDGKVLAAKANDRAYESMVGGRPVPTAGVAGVAVAAEYRSRGLARRIMTHLLHTASERGAVISTLFRTAPALYRSLGYEQVAELCTVELPTAALASLRVPAGIALRRADVSDVPAMRAIYRRVTVDGSCLLTRTGQSFPDDAELLVAAGETTLAVDAAGEVVGYACWDRGTGFGAGAVLSVTDLHALNGDGYRALLSAIGSFSAVAPSIRLRTSGTDPVCWFIPGAGWSVTAVQPYLLRILDAAAAVAARGWPATISGAATFALEDPVCPWNSGVHRLEIGGGEGRLVPVATAEGRAAPMTAPAATGGTGALRMSVNGFAVLYAGGVSPAMLRRSGMLDGGSPGDDEFLAAAFAGPRPAVLDFF